MKRKDFLKIIDHVQQEISMECYVHGLCYQLMVNGFEGTEYFDKFVKFVSKWTQGDTYLNTYRGLRLTGDETYLRRSLALQSFKEEILSNGTLL